MCTNSLQHQVDRALHRVFKDHFPHISGEDWRGCKPLRQDWLWPAVAMHLNAGMQRVMQEICYSRFLWERVGLEQRSELEATNGLGAQQRVPGKQKITPPNPHTKGPHIKTQYQQPQLATATCVHGTCNSQFDKLMHGS